ncbi:hypothetical protein EDD21DRAFT_415811 [Dissophora ornata]|nr:hypothetical protein BGZ58_007563 [Dissophora ornata]KAI8600488.1 hypothetical protein EDD21DRAFT_415811 [Dissophora ornata]
MVPFHGLLLLVFFAGSSYHRQGARLNAGLVQAYQGPGDYFLPSNIYDNLPPGIQTPTATAPIPIPSTTAPGQSTESRVGSSDNDAVFYQSPGLDDPPMIEITTPLLNAVYTPGSGLVVTWTSHDEISFPDNWTPPQSLLDMVTNDPNFSHNPLLTKDDMTNLAKMKLVDLKRAALTLIMKDSPIWLTSLRLVSWPLQAAASDIDDDDQNGDSGEERGPSGSSSQKTFSISPTVLFDPGYSLQNLSRTTILGATGGQLSWVIPEDWEYEGEFEIRIPSVSSGSNGDVQTGKGGSNSGGAGARSHSFWILRDAATRTSNPQYNLPSVGQQPQEGKAGTGSGLFSSRMDVQRQRDMGVFLGVSAMMLAFILVGLGFIVGIYRRSSAPSAPGGELESDACAHIESSLATDSMITTSTPSYSSSSARSAGPLINCKHMEGYGGNPFEHSQGDDDAHSPRDLDLSEETFRGGMSEKATVGGKNERGYSQECEKEYSPVDSTFVDLPLYEAHDSSSTLATARAASNQDLHKTQETAE